MWASTASGETVLLNLLAREHGAELETLLSLGVSLRQSRSLSTAKN